MLASLQRSPFLLLRNDEVKKHDGGGTSTRQERGVQKPIVAKVTPQTGDEAPVPRAGGGYQQFNGLKKFNTSSRTPVEL
jgi:hypothetical protein